MNKTGERLLLFGTVNSVTAFRCAHHEKNKNLGKKRRAPVNVRFRNAFWPLTSLVSRRNEDHAGTTKRSCFSTEFSVVPVLGSLLL